MLSLLVLVSARFHARDLFSGKPFWICWLSLAGTLTTLSGQLSAYLSRCPGGVYMWLHPSVPANFFFFFFFLLCNWKELLAR